MDTPAAELVVGAGVFVAAFEADAEAGEVLAAGAEALGEALGDGVVFVADAEGDTDDFGVALGVVDAEVFGDGLDVVDWVFLLVGVHPASSDMLKIIASAKPIIAFTLFIFEISL